MGERTLSHDSSLLMRTFLTLNYSALSPMVLSLGGFLSTVSSFHPLTDSVVYDDGAVWVIYILMLCNGRGWRDGQGGNWGGGR